MGVPETCVRKDPSLGPSRYRTEGPRVRTGSVTGDGLIPCFTIFRVARGGNRQTGPTPTDEHKWDHLLQVCTDQS